MSEEENIEIETSEESPSSPDTEEQNSINGLSESEQEICEAPDINEVAKYAQESEAGLMKNQQTMDGVIPNMLDPLTINEHIRARVLQSCGEITSTSYHGYHLSVNYLTENFTDEKLNVNKIQYQQEQLPQNTPSNNTTKESVNNTDNNDADDTTSVISVEQTDISVANTPGSQSINKKNQEKKYIRLLKGRKILTNTGTMFDPAMDTFVTAPASKRIALFTERPVIVRNRVYCTGSAGSNKINDMDYFGCSLKKENNIILTEEFQKKVDASATDFGTTDTAMRQKFAANGAGTTSLANVTEILDKKKLIESFRCDACGTSLVDPITLSKCNHTVCKICLLSSFHNNLEEIQKDDTSSDDDIAWILEQYTKIMDQIITNPSFDYFIFESISNNSIYSDEKQNKKINDNRKKLMKKLIGHCPGKNCQEDLVMCHANKKIKEIMQKVWFQEPGLMKLENDNIKEIMIRDNLKMEQLYSMEKVKWPCTCCCTELNVINPLFEPCDTEIKNLELRDRRNETKERKERHKIRCERLSQYIKKLNDALKDDKIKISDEDGDEVYDKKGAIKDLILLNDAEESSSFSDSEIGMTNDIFYDTMFCIYCRRPFCGTKKLLETECWKEVPIGVYPISKDEPEKNEKKTPEVIKKIENEIKRKCDDIIKESLLVDKYGKILPVERKNDPLDCDELIAIKCTSGCSCKRVVEWTSEDLLLRGGFSYIDQLFGNTCDIALIRNYLAKQNKILEIEALEDLKNEILKNYLSSVYPYPNCVDGLINLNTSVCRKCLRYLLMAAVSRYIVINREKWPKEIIMDRPICMLGSGCELQKDLNHCKRFWHGCKNIAGKDSGYFM